MLMNQFISSTNSTFIQKRYLFYPALVPVAYTVFGGRYNRFGFIFNLGLSIFYWTSYFMTSNPGQRRVLVWLAVSIESDKQ